MISYIFFSLILYFRISLGFLPLKFCSAPVSPFKWSIWRISFSSSVLLTQFCSILMKISIILKLSYASKCFLHHQLCGLPQVIISRFLIKDPCDHFYSKNALVSLWWTYSRWPNLFFILQSILKFFLHLYFFYLFNTKYDQIYNYYFNQKLLRLINLLPCSHLSQWSKLMSYSTYQISSLSWWLRIRRSFLLILRI